MDILCCCRHLRSKRKHQHEERPGLSTPPPPTRLPPPVSPSLIASPGSTVARSSLTNPLPGAAADALVQLAELIVEDSDDDNGDLDDDPAQDSRNRSTSTLQAVKSCIRRHLSHDSLSRQSETEEQVARRAEVKRLLRKRIQEELRTEAGIVSSEPPSPSRLVSGQTNFAASGPRDTIEFTVDGNKRVKELAKLKVRHLTTSEKSRHRLSNPISASPAESVVEASYRPDSRAASLPEWVDESKISQAKNNNGIQDRTCIPGIPSSPALLPVPSPTSYDASSLVSWRLSPSAEKLDDLFAPEKESSMSRPVTNFHASCSMADVRKTGPFKRQRSRSSPLTIHDSDTANRYQSRQVSLDSVVRERIPASVSLVRDESPVGLWLRAQSMQFRPSTTSQPPSENGSEAPHAQKETKYQIEVQDAFPATAANTNRTRRQSSLRGSPRQFGNTIKSKTISFETNSSIHSHKGRVAAHVLPGPSHRVNIVPAPKTPEAHTGFSSVEPSAIVPASDSTARSCDHKPLPNPPRKGLGGLRLPSFKWNYASDKSQNSSVPNLTASSRPGSTTPSLSLSNARQTTMEAGSETSSFIRREAELQAVEERFRDSHLRLEPLVPFESRFKEMFDHDGDPNAIRRNSLLNKLRLSVPKRYKPGIFENLDGNGSDRIASVNDPSRKPGPQPYSISSPKTSDHGYLKIPVAGYGSRRERSSGTSLRSSRKSGESERPRGFSSSKEGDETAQIWKRALRAETESKSLRGSLLSNVPEAPPLSGAVSEVKAVPTTLQSSDHKSLSLSPPGIHSPTCGERQSRDDEATFRETLMRSNAILQQWANQLDNRVVEADERRRHHASVSGPFLQVTMMPLASWARFPSHNRKERNATAGEADDIKSRDFAVKKISAAGEVNWTTDKLHGGLPTPTGIGRSFSDKFASTVKARWSKFIPGRSGTPSRNKLMQSGRRSSIQAGGNLEYPELELLPSACRYKELRALEREIDDMKGVKSKSRTSDPIFAHHGRPSLIDKMAGALQQHDGGSVDELSKTSDTASFVKEEASMVRIRAPDAPAIQSRSPDVAHTKDVSESTVERYATPFSHFTASDYEPSRAATPDFETNIRLPSTTHSPSSAKSFESVVRRESLHSTPDLGFPPTSLGRSMDEISPRDNRLRLSIAPDLA
ncbi:hypothetical protein VP1G_06204 [Cytospora mali]|uniref:Uncharacterized protein n=1 Tax=Cytospora mali TaxID=578113 RepID=A0A194V4U2_CYTMA|nr:hypothetical protein VP1G_06204 [Valsa mali var. pyri (nom. inval.)]